MPVSRSDTDLFARFAELSSCCDVTLDHTVIVGWRVKVRNRQTGEVFSHSDQDVLSVVALAINAAASQGWVAPGP